MTQTITLEAPSASGKKSYTVDLVEAPNGFTVDFRYGAVGGSVKTGTKTKQPVDSATAQRIFDALVASKINGNSHYRSVGTSATPLIAPADDIGQCEFCGNPNVPLVATLQSDPDQRVCSICHADPHIPTRALRAECLPPRLLNDVDPGRINALTNDSDWWFQIKHDGDRVQFHLDQGIITLYSARSGKLRPCPKTIADAVANYPNSLILDGELVGDVLWAFDLLSVTVASPASPPCVRDAFPDKPYEIRHAYLSMILDAIGSPSIILVHSAKDTFDKLALISAAQDNHCEGVCFINKNATYEPGRPNAGGNNLRWKFKARASVIVAAHNLKNSVQIMLGDTSPIGTVSIQKGPLPPVGSIIDVEYLYCQTSLVQPVYKGIRTDIPAEACTRSQLQFKDGIDPTTNV